MRCNFPAGCSWLSVEILVVICHAMITWFVLCWTTRTPLPGFFHLPSARRNQGSGGISIPISIPISLPIPTPYTFPSYVPISSLVSLSIPIITDSIPLGIHLQRNGDTHPPPRCRPYSASVPQGRNAAAKAVLNRKKKGKRSVPLRGN